MSAGCRLARPSPVRLSHRRRARRQRRRPPGPHPLRCHVHQAEPAKPRRDVQPHEPRTCPPCGQPGGRSAQSVVMYSANGTRPTSRSSRSPLMSCASVTASHAFVRLRRTSAAPPASARRTGYGPYAAEHGRRPPAAAPAAAPVPIAGPERSAGGPGRTGGRAETTGLNVLYTATAHATGDGRDGHATTDDGRLDLDLRIPGDGRAGWGHQPRAALRGGLRRLLPLGAEGGGPRRLDVDGSEVSASVGIGALPTAASGWRSSSTSTSPPRPGHRPVAGRRCPPGLPLLQRHPGQHRRHADRGLST